MTKKQIHVLLFTSIFIFFSYPAFANQREQNKGKFYIQAIRLLIKKEAKFPPLQNGKAASILQNFYSEAVAADTDCIIAGYVGTLVGKSCKYPKDVSPSAGNITCNPKVFGELSIPKPSNAQWTLACGNEFLKKAGIADKTVDDDFVDADYDKINTYLGTQKVNLADIKTELGTVCAAADTSKRTQDSADCKQINDFFNAIKSSTTPNANCPNNTTTPKAAEVLTEAAQQALFKYDASKHMACNVDPKSKSNSTSLYGLIPVRTVEDLKKIQDQNGKTCYQKYFEEQVIIYLSAQLNELDFEKNKNGFTKTLRINKCDLNINFSGNDVSKYKKHPNDQNLLSYLSSSLTRKTEYGTKQTGSTSEQFYVNTDLKSPTDTNFFSDQTHAFTNDKLFNETLKQSYTSYDNLITKLNQKNGTGNKSEEFMKQIADDAYNYCSDYVND